MSKHEERQKTADPLKVVVRKLPAAIPEQVVWTSIDQTGVTAWDWRVFIPGKQPASRGKEGRASRAYIRFKTIDAVVEFNRLYNGHLFKDAKGNISEAQVEFAPSQKIAQPPKRQDARQGSIEQDPDYLHFVQSLTKTSEVSVARPAAAETAKGEPVLTPLVDHLRSKRQKHAEKESLGTAESSATKSKEKEKEPALKGQSTITKAKQPAKNVAAAKSQVESPAKRANKPTPAAKTDTPIGPASTLKPALSASAPTSAKDRVTTAKGAKSKATVLPTVTPLPSVSQGDSSRPIHVKAPAADSSANETNDKVNENGDAKAKDRKRVNTTNRLFGQALGGTGKRGRGGGQPHPGRIVSAAATKRAEFSNVSSGKGG